MSTCTSDKDIRKMVRFNKSKPIIAKGSTTLLDFVDGDLSNFFHIIDTYQTQSIILGGTGGTGSVNLDMNFIFVKALWPTDALESEKKLELQLSTFEYAGGTGPLGATGISNEKIPFKDIFVINSVESHENLNFTNNTKHQVTINILTAKL